MRHRREIHIAVVVAVVAVAVAAVALYRTQYLQLQVNLLNTKADLNSQLVRSVLEREVGTLERIETLLRSQPYTPVPTPQETSDE